MAITKISNSSLKNLNKYDSFLAGNAAYIPNDFDSIQTVTASGSSTYVEFTSIPQTYKHLQIRYVGRSSSSNAWDFVRMQINGATSGYSDHNLYSDGSSAGSQGGGGGTNIFMSFAATSSSSSGIMGATIADILDYTNTTKYKTVRAFSGADNNSTGYAGLLSGSYQSTSAVSSIKLFLTYGPNWTSGSTFALYGIK
jgi:hypothetical protein